MLAMQKWTALLVVTTAVLSSLPAAGQAQQTEDKIYKYRDADGNVRYSDQPQAGAEEISVNPVVTDFTSVPATTPNILTAPPPADAAVEASVNQVDLTLIEPSAEQAVRANNGTVEFRWRADAERLTSGLIYRLVLDNVLVYEGDIPQVTLENLDRGAHEFVVEAYLANQPLTAANRLTETAPTTFYLQRHSRLFPNGSN